MGDEIKPRGDSWVYKHSLSELRDMYRQELQLNRNRLERNSLQQATIFDRWHSALEDVEADIADEERRKSRYLAKVELRLREKHPKWKEGQFKASLLCSKKGNVFAKRLSLMRRYRGTLKGAVESCRQRKSMIQTLKDLYTSAYWSKTTPGGTPYGKSDKLRRKKKG